MKKINITYWIVTGLFAFVMAGSAIPDIISAREAVEGFSTIGMPTYLLPFLGIAKILGVIAILVPGSSRVKEWAYAGLTFDLIGATYALIASGQPIATSSFMVLPLTLAVLSYSFYHKRMKAAKQAGAATRNEGRQPNIVHERISTGVTS